MDDSILTRLLEALDFLVLEWIDGRSFRHVGKVPGWFENLQLHINLKACSESFQFGDAIPFLENFLIDAEKFWTQETEGWTRSGTWMELDNTGSECALEATAVSLGDRKILLIQPGFSRYLEKRRIIQHGRELSLEYRRLQRWEKELVARQQQLEDLIAERTRELTESNESLRKEVAARKRAEEFLRAEEEKFRSLIEQCPFGVVSIEKGVPQYVNPTFAAIFDCRLEDLRSDAELRNILLSTFSPETSPSPLQAPEIALDQAARLPASKTLTNRGVERVVRGRSVSSGPTEFLFLEDVTEQKRLEHHLIQAQKMEVVGTLAGGVAHDFNNLLQMIRGYAELLLMRRPESNFEAAGLQEIVEACSRGGELTRQLLTVSRQLETRDAALDLNETVRRVYRLLGRTLPKMIEVKLLLAPELGLITGDAAQLEQVVVNLAINARDAMPEGGQLTIETSNQTLDGRASALLPGVVPGDYVMLRVTDTGVGMDTETQGRMFEPFFTTKEPGRGAGLGLAMVYGITKSHHARIFCESAPGAGTCFRIYFPRSHTQSPVSVSVQTTIPTGDELVMLVEDEESLRSQGEEIIGSFGYRVISEPDAESALRRFEQEHESIDLVVLDLVMPGMGGQKCLEELLKIDPAVKVIITSGLADARNRPELRAAKGFVAKPYSLAAILQTIREVIDKP